MRTLVLVTTLAALPVGLHAQANPAPRGCFQPRPADRCRWFPLIEGGVLYRVSGLNPDDNRFSVDWKLGFMKNTGPRTAIGGLVFATAGGDLRAGAAVRWRRWLSPASSLDLSAGLNILGADAAAAPTVEARIATHDLLSVSARVDVLHISSCLNPSCSSTSSRASPRLYIGAGTGSVGGVIGYGATAVLFVIAFIALSSGFND